MEHSRSVGTSQQTTPWPQRPGINSLCLFPSGRWLSTSKASTGGHQPLLPSGAQAVGTALPDNTRDAAWEGAWWKLLPPSWAHRLCAQGSYSAPLFSICEVSEGCSGFPCRSCTRWAERARRALPALVILSVDACLSALGPRSALAHRAASPGAETWRGHGDQPSVV